MRFLVDTNVLVAATVEALPEHTASCAFVEAVVRGTDPWCLCWVNVYEFLRVVTHPRVFQRPLRWEQALLQVKSLLGHPALEVLAETPRHVEILTRVVAEAGGASGNFVHDCHVAALMAEHDVRRIVTFDAHYRRFVGLNVVSPAEASARQA